MTVLLIIVYVIGLPVAWAITYRASFMGSPPDDDFDRFMGALFATIFAAAWPVCLVIWPTLWVILEVGVKIVGGLRPLLKRLEP